ncbi:hypothetical protein DV738_g4705, partial [Chaetothyriales sp. CBS 135597]
MLNPVKPILSWLRSEPPTDVHSNDVTPSQIYHIVLITSNLSKNPTNAVEKVRITGTYVTAKAAKAAAHQVVYDAGYEIEMFKTYDVDHDKLQLDMAKAHEDGNGLVVHATAQDGTEFKVYVHPTPNPLQLSTDEENGRVRADLFYVVQTEVDYNGDDIKIRRHSIDAVFTKYLDARKAALTTLLDKKSGTTKDSFAAWDEAGETETDCGYGENVLVHAVGQNGDNFLVSVIKGQVMESVRLAEAAMRMRR